MNNMTVTTIPFISLKMIVFVLLLLVLPFICSAVDVDNSNLQIPLVLRNMLQQQQQLQNEQHKINDILKKLDAYSSNVRNNISNYPINKNNNIRHKRKLHTTTNTTTIITKTTDTTIVDPGTSTSSISSNNNNKITNHRVLVLLIKFADHNNRSVPSKEYFQSLFNDTGISNINPIGSIREYLHSNSVGQYNVQFDVADWKVTNNTEQFFSKGVSGRVSPTEMQSLFIPVLQQLLQNDNEYTNFKQFDMDNNNIMDHLIILHSGYAAEAGNTIPDDCTLNVANDRIWSQGFPNVATPYIISTTSNNNNSTSNTESISINNFAIASAFTNELCKGTANKMGIIVHEYLHGIGLMDLYDQDLNDEYLPVGGIGSFDPMSNQYGWQRNQSVCGHLSAYSRMKLKWIEPIDIVQDGYYPLIASEASAQIYKITLGFDQEYLLIENRQPLLWDSDIEGGGIVIYHVDDMLYDQSSRGYPGHPNWPTEHYMVSVLQADGKYDIEQDINHGDTNDFYIKGMSLTPSNGDNTIWPNTDQIWTGTAVSTGITIEIMTISQFIMMIHVTGIQSVTTSTTVTRLVNATTTTTTTPLPSSSISDLDVIPSSSTTINNPTTTTSSSQTSSSSGGTQGHVRSILSFVFGTAALVGILAILL